jgi:multisubunit Na+/H+ antiporter MnhG subunit
MDGRETRPALTVSFRLERGGQFESGFQVNVVTGTIISFFATLLVYPLFGAAISTVQHLRKIKKALKKMVKERKKQEQIGES